MIFSVVVSEQADEDLRNIYEYIAFELRSPEYAIRQLDRLENSILNLDQMPERFRRYDKEPWCSRGLRIMPIDHYCVFYVPNTEKATVTIIRVMYSGRNIEEQLLKK